VAATVIRRLPPVVLVCASHPWRQMAREASRRRFSRHAASAQARVKVACSGSVISRSNQLPADECSGGLCQAPPALPAARRATLTQNVG